ncbi:MAG: precorrin-3B synthase [Hyphomicrobiaceae bacterium]|nr:precorrin-3B synthase [Hyphomicrobiaceae bacterium]
MTRGPATVQIRGWCPGALRPMLSGDGYIVRVRPRGGVLSPAQARGIARAAETYGNGCLELTARASLQVRGVALHDHVPLVDALGRLGLVDADIASDARRNVIVTPFRADGTGAETAQLACDLEAALAQGPDLPGKFGFAVDTAVNRALAGASADIRIERAIDGSLLIRPDGGAAGRQVTAETAVSRALDLADWFLATGGMHDGRGRMARHIAAGAVLPEPTAWSVPPAPTLAHAGPGPHAEGVLVAAAFGQFEASALSALADLGADLRLTPWRMLLVVGQADLPAIPGLVTDPNHPILAVTACPGAPACPQALGPTRPLARALAAHVPAGRHLHVSGCAKGCAHPAAASLTLVATPDGYDLVRDGRAGDAPASCGLTEAALVAVPARFVEGRP